MGHHWREMDPAGAEAHDRYLNRKEELQKKLKDVPLGEFKAGELESVMRLFGLYYNLAGQCRLTEEHFKILEAKAASMT